MHNNLKNYSLNTGSGTQLGFEYDRVNALTGRRKEDYLQRLPDTALIRYSAGVDEDSAKMHALMDETNLYVLDANGSVHLTLMTETAYNMIRRPDVSVLKKVSLTAAIKALAAGKLPDASTSRSYTKNWLIHSTVYNEHIQLARIVNNFLSVTNDYLQSKSNLLDDEAARQLFAFDTSAANTLLYSDGIALKSLAALAIQADAVTKSEYWALSMRSAWEELVQTGNNHRRVSDLYMRLAGPEKFLDKLVEKNIF